MKIIYNATTGISTARPKAGYRTQLISQTQRSIIVTTSETHRVKSKVYKWKPKDLNLMTKTTIEHIARNHHLTDKDYKDIATGLRTGTLIGASDGSFKNGYQIGGLTLYNKATSNLITGQCPVPGNPST